MIDVTDYRVCKKENRGVHPNKVWLETPEVLYGKKRMALLKITEKREDGSDMFSHFAEMLYSDIANELLGFPCAKIEKVMYDGRVGILSYNVLDNIPNNNEDYTRYILQDMASIINSTEHDFDMENLKVRDKNEYYSVEMILKSFKKACCSEQEYKELEEYIINLCLVDSVTNYEDRHSMNLSAGYDNYTGSIFPVAIYDNGGCLGFNIPKEQVTKAIIKGVDAKRIREVTTSKIGILSKTPISFDLLESLIFNHYYQIAKPMAKRIATSLSPENIKKILAREDYADMPECYKTFVKNQIEYNRTRMLERLSKSRYRDYLEQYINNEEKLDKYAVGHPKVKKSEETARVDALNNILGNVFFGDSLKIDGDILSQEDFRILEEIENSPETFCDGQMICLEHDKNIAKWSVIYNRLLKLMDNSISEETRMKQLNDVLIKKMNFYIPDIEEINILSNIYEKKLEFQDRSEIRKFVNGTSSKKGIGEDRVDSYLILQHAKSVVINNDTSVVEDFEKKYIDILEKENTIDEFLGKGLEKFSFIKNAGVSDEEEIYRLVYFALDKVKSRNRHFASKEDFENFIIEQAKYFEKGKYSVIAGKIISKKDLEMINNNIYTLPNGEKAVIIDTKISGLNNIVMGMGIDHTIQIQGVNENGDYNLTFAHRNGTEFPPEVRSILDDVETRAKKFPNFRRIVKKFRSKKEDAVVSELFSYNGNVRKGSDENMLLDYDSEDIVDSSNPLDDKIRRKLTGKIKNYVLTMYGRKDKVKDDSSIVY